MNFIPRQMLHKHCTNSIQHIFLPLHLTGNFSHSTSLHNLNFGTVLCVIFSCESETNRFQLRDEVVKDNEAHKTLAEVGLLLDALNTSKKYVVSRRSECFVIIITKITTFSTLKT